MNRNIVNYEVCRDTFPRTVNIDGGWKFQYGPFMPGDELSGKCTARTVNLPHDYMLEDNVCEQRLWGITTAGGLIIPKPSVFPLYGRRKRSFCILTES